jgi:uncharacterized protein YecE (DUF72 family)
VSALGNPRHVYVGTSGWSLSRHVAPGSRPGLTGLERYAEYFNAVEVNSTFYRLPLRATIERWRDATPDGFRFAVKLPRSITHEARLVDTETEATAFCELVAGFGKKLGPLLVQLPPSLELDVTVAGEFLRQLTRVAPTPVVLEPRHPTWFSDDAERLLVESGVARAAADPACCVAAMRPGATASPSYFRWHGSPRKYFSAYFPETIAALAQQILATRRKGARSEAYCFFDNTALGAASVNAISLKAELLVTPGFRPRAAPAADDGSAASPTGREER